MRVHLKLEALPWKHQLDSRLLRRLLGFQTNSILDEFKCFTNKLIFWAKNRFRWIVFQTNWPAAYESVNFGDACSQPMVPSATLLFPPTFFKTFILHRRFANQFRCFRLSLVYFFCLISFDPFTGSPWTCLMSCNGWNTLRALIFSLYCFYHYNYHH